MTIADDRSPAILAEGLRKHFPGRGAALDGFDLAVAPGTVHGLLGPNGAGKTTAVRILSTLLRLDAGRARVAGCDVARDPGVRERIGVAGQRAAGDEVLSGRQNLEMFARLHHCAHARRGSGPLPCWGASTLRPLPTGPCATTPAVCVGASTWRSA